jgi:hypothetical protein
MPASAMTLAARRDGRLHRGDVAGHRDKRLAAERHGQPDFEQAAPARFAAASAP